MDENYRKERIEKFDALMNELDEELNILPKLGSKFMGLSIPFPELVAKKVRTIESIKKLKKFDKDICIAVLYDKVDEESIIYKDLIFIGNDYLHLVKVVDFMKSEKIILDTKNLCVIYREFTDDLNINLKGNHTRITSINDLFSVVEIQIGSNIVGFGYTYEDNQMDQDIIHYCCSKDDEEGKVLGYQLFKKSLECYSIRLLTEGFTLGYPVVDANIKLMKSSCSMCFYRYYYYTSGAWMALKNAFSKAVWQVYEPLMEINLVCIKQYFYRSSLFKDLKNVSINDKNELYELKFECELSQIIDYIYEFYNKNEEVLKFSMQVIGYVKVKNEINKKYNFRLIYDLGELTK